MYIKILLLDLLLLELPTVCNVRRRVYLVYIWLFSI